jgi:hypothetical protein
MMNCLFSGARWRVALLSVFSMLLLLSLLLSPLLTGSFASAAESGSDAGASDCSNPDQPGCYTEAVTNTSVDCDNGKGVRSELGNFCVPKDPAGFAQTYYKIGLSAIGGLSLLFIIFGGYLFLTSEGNPDRLNNGKTFIFYALFGLLLAIFGYVFIEVVAIDILHLPGFSH